MLRLQKSVEMFSTIRKDTQRNYHYAINRHLNDWLDMPIASITKDMVEQRHQELTVSPNRLGTSGHGRANNALKKLLDVPPYVLKRLVNHNVSNDMTGRYLVLDIERLRSHMCRISNAFVDLLGVNDIKEWKPIDEYRLTEVTQLRIPLSDWSDNVD